MKKSTLLLSTALAAALATSPALASKNEDDDRGYDKGRYLDHYKQRHQMNMDMMHMLSETMTILRDLNHMPSAKQREQLDDMIKQLNEMISTHKEMGEKLMDRMHRRMDDDDDRRGKRWSDRDDDR